MKCEHCGTELIANEEHYDYRDNRWACSATRTAPPGETSGEQKCPSCGTRMNLICDPTGQTDHYHCFKCEPPSAPDKDAEKPLKQRFFINGIGWCFTEADYLAQRTRAEEGDAELATLRSINKELREALEGLAVQVSVVFWTTDSDGKNKRDADAESLRQEYSKPLGDAFEAATKALARAAEVTKGDCHE